MFSSNCMQCAVAHKVLTKARVCCGKMIGMNDCIHKFIHILIVLYNCNRTKRNGAIDKWKCKIRLPSFYRKNEIGFYFFRNLHKEKSLRLRVKNQQCYDASNSKCAFAFAHKYTKVFNHNHHTIDFVFDNFRLTNISDFDASIAIYVCVCVFWSSSFQNTKYYIMTIDGANGSNTIMLLIE